MQEEVRMPSKAPKELIAHVIETMAYNAQAFEIALDIDADPDDREIVLDQLDAAGEHIAGVIWTLHPRWREMDRRASEMEAIKVFRRYKPDIDESFRGTGALLDAVYDSMRAARDGVTAARWRGPQRRFRDAAVELACASDHLENVAYLLDADRFIADVDATTPHERVQLASRIEVIELALDENRAYVRGRAAIQN